MQIMNEIHINSTHCTSLHKTQFTSPLILLLPYCLYELTHLIVIVIVTIDFLTYTILKWGSITAITLKVNPFRFINMIDCTTQGMSTPKMSTAQYEMNSCRSLERTQRERERAFSARQKLSH